MTDDEKVKFIRMQEDISHLKEDVSEVKQGVKDLHSKIDEGFLNLTQRNAADLVKLAQDIEKKYANKWTEKVLVGIGGIVGTAIVIAIVELIIKR